MESRDTKFKFKVKTVFKPCKTPRKILVHLKDKLPDINKCGTIYHIKCSNCNGDYIGESGRSLGKRIEEHQKSVAKQTLHSALSEHSMKTNHSIDWDGVKVLQRETAVIPRKICEAIQIKRKTPSLNRDGGYMLPPVYEAVVSRDSMHQ